MQNINERHNIMQYIQFLVGSRPEGITSVCVCVCVRACVCVYIYRPLYTKVRKTKKSLCHWSLPTAENGRLIVIR